MSNIIQVFIENPAGSKIKNIHDENTLEFTRSIPVARPTPSRTDLFPAQPVKIETIWTALC